MRSRLGRPLLRVPAGLRVGIVIGVALALTGLAVGTATGVQQAFQQVLVINPATSPVPVVGARADGTLAVSGSVNVGNFPTTQAVSGNVGIAGTPTVKIGDTTRIIASGSVTVGPQQTASLIQKYLDVSGFKTLTFYMSLGGIAPLSDQVMLLSTTDGTHNFTFDGFVATQPAFSRTWDPAPPSVGVDWLNEDPSNSETIQFMLVGRAN